MSALLKQKALGQFRSVAPLIIIRTVNTRITPSNKTARPPPNSAKAPSFKTPTSTPPSAPRPPNHFDVIIGGGGLVGTTLAAALGRHKAFKQKTILLLEAAPPFKGFSIKAPYSNRVSAINQNTIELFKSIGAWQLMLASRVKPVKQMQVWDGSSDALIQFQHPHFSDDVACIVENDLMLDTMYQQLANTPNVTVRHEAKMDSVRLPAQTRSQNSEVSLKTGEQYTCELLIGADGANSLVRTQMGVEVYSIDYERMGVVATLEMNESTGNSVAWQRFIPTGPIALLPLSDKMSSLVWSTTIPHAKELLAMPDNEFVDALNEAFCKEFPKSEIVKKAMEALNSFIGRSLSPLRQYPPQAIKVLDKSRAAFPLGFMHASSYITQGACIIGDAAHRIHPLAGQGVNLGFSDVRFLVDTLAMVAGSGSKLGNRMFLVKYEQKSLSKNVPIMIGVHGIQALYSTTSSPAVLLRSLGLNITNNVPSLKNLFMKSAMGD